MTDDLAAAVALHKAGRLEEAEAAYLALIARDPGNADARHMLGGIAYQRGDLTGALAHYDQAAAGGLGDLSDALQFNRGNVLKALGRRDEAIAAFRRTVAINQDNLHAWYNLGLLLQGGDDAAAAEVAYRRALALDPRYRPARNNLAVLLHGQGRLDEAEALLRALFAEAPDDPDPLCNLANLLYWTDRFGEAEHWYARALTVRPDMPEVLRQSADTLKRLGRPGEAVARYRESLVRAPGNAAAVHNLGAALSDLDAVDAAEAAYRTAARLAPDDPSAPRNLGILLQRVGRRDDAVAAYTEALARAPLDVDARLGLAIAQIPVVPADDAEIAEGRAAYRRQLEDFIDDLEFAPPDEWRAAATAVGAIQPFYLAYLGEDERALQTLYGGMVCRVAAAAAGDAAPEPEAPCPAPPPVGAVRPRPRVGFVSGFFHWHSVWAIPLQGWVAQLDASRFELVCYDTQARRDGATEAAEAAAARFVKGPLTIAEWRRVLQDDACDVLIYPELGMDPVSARLAAERFAPVQATALGHPLTSGRPTMDLFLSSALMEPPDGDAHYTERLIRLPNLGVHYTPPFDVAPATSRSDLGLPEDAVVYWCCQSLFKYLPRHDAVFPEIAAAVPAACFVFIEAPFAAMTARFRARLERAFAAKGLEAARHIRFLPRLTLPEFAAAAAACDLALDAIGWSGFNTTLETLQAGVPVITVAGPLMRSRHTTGVLTLIEMTDLIAPDVAGYVALAIALGRDPARRQALADRVRADRVLAAHDPDAIDGLETVLTDAVAAARPVA